MHNKNREKVHLLFHTVVFGRSRHLPKQGIVFNCRRSGKARKTWLHMCMSFLSTNIYIYIYLFAGPDTMLLYLMLVWP